MDKILNITNGDCAITIMQEAAIPGEFLPWRDVLHEGPVPAALSLEELSKIRAQYIAGQGWGAVEDVETSFIHRDKYLQSFRDYDKVILWFEHDLYDQLQLIQILDWFSDNLRGEIELAIICTEQYLGRATAGEMDGLKRFEEPVTEEHLTLAGKAWAAFRSDSPEEWQGLLNMDTSILPFLRGAVLRMLEEFPHCGHGLSRSEHQALEIISQGEIHAGQVFGLCQKKEERIFMGDSSFWRILHALLKSDPPLLQMSNGKALTLPTSPDHQVIGITQAGRSVLSGEKSWMESEVLDRWIGGVHLKPLNLWCWDADCNSIVKLA